MDYAYNITKTEKGILIHDPFFICDWDGFMYSFGRHNIAATTNLGDLKLQTIQTSRMQIEDDPDPEDVFFIIEDTIFRLDGEYYYYRDWADISKMYHNECICQGYKMAELPNIKRGGFIGDTHDFELLPCKKSFDKPFFIID